MLPLGTFSALAVTVVALIVLRVQREDTYTRDRPPTQIVVTLLIFAVALVAAIVLLGFWIWDATRSFQEAGTTMSAG